MAHTLTASWLHLLLLSVAHWSRHYSPFHPWTCCKSCCHCSTLCPWFTLSFEASSPRYYMACFLIYFKYCFLSDMFPKYLFKNCLDPHFSIRFSLFFLKPFITIWLLCFKLFIHYSLFPFSLNTNTRQENLQEQRFGSISIFSEI